MSVNIKIKNFFSATFLFTAANELSDAGSKLLSSTVSGCAVVCEREKERVIGRERGGRGE